MMSIVRNLWHEDQGQDIAEYAVMLAVILVIVVGTIRLVGSNANNVFSSVAAPSNSGCIESRSGAVADSDEGQASPKAGTRVGMGVCAGGGGER